MILSVMFCDTSDTVCDMFCDTTCDVFCDTSDTSNVFLKPFDACVKINSCQMTH